MKSTISHSSNCKLCLVLQALSSKILFSKATIYLHSYFVITNMIVFFSRLFNLLKGGANSVEEVNDMSCTGISKSTDHWNDFHLWEGNLIFLKLSISFLDCIFVSIVQSLYFFYLSTCSQGTPHWLYHDHPNKRPILNSAILL